MPVPCLRPDDMTFDYETAIVLENADGTVDRYECRIEFDVASDDSVIIRQVDVWGGSRWQDAARVEEPVIANSLYAEADDMADLLFDTVRVQVEDRRAEQERHDYELRIDNADDRGHAHRERMAERRMG